MLDRDVLWNEANVLHKLQKFGNANVVHRL